MNTYVVVFLLILLIAYVGYKFSAAEHLVAGGVLTGDICDAKFGINEDLRVGLANSAKFERWYLTKDNILSIQQGSVQPGGKTFKIENMYTKQFTDNDLSALRKLYQSQFFKDISSGVYRPDVTTYDRVLCNPADKGWLWTYMTLDRCISVECRGKKPACDSIQDEIRRLSSMVPGYRSVKP
jgi:hypothetical protein